MRRTTVALVLVAILIQLVPGASASATYRGQYVAGNPAAYAGVDGCYWAGANFYLTQPAGDNCVHMLPGSDGHAYSVAFDGSVVPPTLWHVCFCSSALISCGTGGTIPVGAGFFSFSADDGALVKWAVTVL